MFDRTRALALWLLATAVVAVSPSRASSQVALRAGCKAPSETMDHATMDHARHLALQKECETAAARAVPTLQAQAAFGAIGEIVRILKDDPNTDWAKVNLEVLRQHFIDMDEVTLHSRVVQKSVPGGISAEVTGTGRSVASIRRMLPQHSRLLDASADLHSTTIAIPEGIRIVTTAKQPSDSALVARIRALGFVGMRTDGDHHARHHIALARGDAMAHVPK